MIVCRTPLRVSFVGGGSDLPSYYKYGYGAVFSTTINKYVNIIVNERYNGGIRASYSQTENVDRASRIKNERIRESLKFVGLDSGIELVSVSDVPSAGTGLGSSSAYVVGILNALKTFKKEKVVTKRLAEAACEVEINKCKARIGKQDQYAATFGGFNKIVFLKNGSVKVIPVKLSTLVINKLRKNLLMLYTGKTRSAHDILKVQSSNLDKNFHKRALMDKMVNLVDPLIKSLTSGDADSMGRFLDENWMLKKQIADEISTEQIDKWYALAKKNGALGGKILGAGNGGFLLLYVPEKHQPKVLKALSKLKRFYFDFEPEGSKIVFNDANE
jgi:D-glycero-alpha-D-manno-heptose-7-phosphate kinase